MKLKAPQGAGDPCVAGVTIAARGGVYEVEPEIGAVLIESFGFVEIEAAAVEKVKAMPTARRGKSAARSA